MPDARLICARRDVWYEIVSIPGKHRVVGIGELLDESRLLDLWQISKVPVIAFHGSVKQIVQWALGAVDSVYSLRFAKLPCPADTLVQKRGPEALVKAVDASVGLVDQLWLQTTQGRSTGSPMDLRAIEVEMMLAIETVPDEKLWTRYAAEVSERVRKLVVQGRTVVRANGNSFHSTSPSSIHLNRMDRQRLSLREAEIIVRLAKDPLGADVEKLAGAKVSDFTKKIISEIIGQESKTLGPIIEEAQLTLKRAGLTS